MAKAISLKVDDKIFEETESRIAILGVSRNSYINEALEAYNKEKKRQEIIEKLKIEVELVRESSMEVLAEFESLEDEID